MAQLAVLFSGEHPTLPAAEAQALLAVHDAAAALDVSGLVGIVTPGPMPPGTADAHPTPPARSPAATALQRMALASEWGALWGETHAGEGSGQRVAQIVAARAPAREGDTAQARSAGVRFERRGTRKNPDAMGLQAAAGRALAAAGFRIDLTAPDVQVVLWLVDERILVVERQGGAEAWPYASRAVDQRAHFSPVSLHPRRAAALLHLTRAPPGTRVLDPFCGTGGLVLEAATEGYDAWGSDVDGFMVQGTLEALADAGEAPLDGTVFEADISAVPDLVEGVAGIVADLPYGRASSTQGEELADLYSRSLAAFAKLLAPGGRAVVGVAQPELLTGAVAAGFRVAERHEERMHRSLTRHFVVLERAA